MVRNRFAQIRDRFATDSRKFSTRFAQIRNRFAKVLDGCATDSHKFARVHTRYSRIRDRFADSQWIRGFAMGFADSRRFATDSRKSSTQFAPIRDRFATDSRIRTHNSPKFARIRDGYYTVLRVKCASRDGHVTRSNYELHSRNILIANILIVHYEDIGGGS